MSGNQVNGAAGSAGDFPLREDLLFLVHQALNEAGFHETAHSLERDTRMYFDLKYLEELIIARNWAEADWYLRGFFVDVRGNRYARLLVFEIYKQKYLEALYRQDMVGADAVLQTEFRSILSTDEDVYQELTGLLFMKDFRAHPRLLEWDNPEKARAALWGKMRKVILHCPDLRDKLQYPAIPPSRMSSMLSESVFWQHYACERRLPNPVWTTLLEDHNCSEFMVPLSSTSASPLPRPPQHFGPLPLPPSNNVLMSSSAGPSTVDIRGKLATYVRSVRNVGETFRQTNMELDTQGGDSAVPANRFCASEPSTSVHQSAHQILPERSNDAAQKSYNIEELPTSMVGALHLGSSGSLALSMDFNPIQQTLLLVGTSLGEISIWDLSSEKRMHHKSFGLENNSVFSDALQEALDKETVIFPVRSVLWSPDGSHFAVAYCMHLVQMYQYNGDGLIWNFEIYAHKGGINDIAFSQPIKMMFVVTGGDDGAIRVWNAVSGLLVHTFGADNSEPILSICPLTRGLHQYIVSVSRDGKINSWRFDKNEPEHEFDGPKFTSVSMAATNDGSRLFSCGFIKSRTKIPILVEWNEPHNHIIKCYFGLSVRNDRELQFHIANNHFLAVGDDSKIKFWSVGESKSICSVDADGGLPKSPRIRFNKSGSLLAVSANGSIIKILASKTGREMLSSSHQPLKAQTSSDLYEAGPSNRAILPLSRPNTSLAAVESGSNVGTSNLTKGTYTPVPPIIELDEDSDQAKISASHPNKIN